MFEHFSQSAPRPDLVIYLQAAPATLAERDDATLVATILDGRPGTPMPPWRRFINDPEATWLVQRLRAGESGSI